MRDFLQISPAATHGIDCGALSVAVATVAGWLPAIASLFSIVWFGLQIGAFCFRVWKKRHAKTRA